MDRVALLECMKLESEEATKDLLLPVAMQKKDKEQPEDRAAKIYLMRVPNGSAATKKTPYILHQVITGKDWQPPGERDESRTTVRSIFAVYHPDEQIGSLYLLNLMERLRIHLLKKIVIGDQFELDKEQGVEVLIYPGTEETTPYYAGEMVTTWKLPAVEREVTKWLK